MTALRTLLPILLLAALIASPRAGYDLWTVEGGPFGGRIATLHVRAGTGEIFAGTEGGGAFRRDAGVWIARSNGLFPLDAVAFATNPLHPDTMFAGTGGGGVHRSANGGDSWFPVNNGLGNLTVHDLRFRAGGGRLFAATGGGGIFFTDDAGHHWFPSNAGLTNLSVRCLVDAPSSPNTWYAGTDAGVFRSPDGGANWVLRSTGLADPIVAALAVDPRNGDVVYAATKGGGVYRTLDGGLSWAPRRTGMGEVYAEDLWIRADRPDTIWAATRSGVYETYDAGGAWTARKIGLDDTVATAILARDDTLYVGTYWGGVFRAVSPASGWSSWNEGLADRFVWELSVSPHDPGVVWAASYGGVSVTADTGWTWSDAPAGITKFDARTVAVSPTDPNRILAGFFYGGVYRSTNAGSTWVPSNSGLPANATVTALRFRPDNGNRVLCGTYSGPYRSLNAGASWGASSSGIGSKKIWGLATVATAPLLVYAGTYEDGLFRSRDFGATWDSVPLPEQYVRAIAVDPSDTSIVYAGGYYTEGAWGGVYKSTTGGATWTRKNDGLGSESVWCLTVDGADPSHVLAATAGGVFESWNGADSWNPLCSGLIALDTRWVLWTGGRVLAGSFGGSVPWYEDAISAVPGAPGVPRRGVSLAASPNPFNPLTTIRIAAAGAPFLRLAIYDPAGRLVRALYDGASGRESLAVVWDATDGAGSEVASGVYFAVVSAEGTRAATKVILVR